MQCILTWLNLDHLNAMPKRADRLRSYYNIYSEVQRFYADISCGVGGRRIKMKNRKPILIVDEGPDSLKAINLLKERDVEFVEYDIRKFAESCCGDLPTTKAPSVFAPEGVFKGLSGVKEYVTSVVVAASAVTNKAIQSESESAYW
jgi:hypothetical protein